MIQDERDLAVGSRANLLRKRRQFGAEDRQVDGVGPVPLRVPRGRMHPAHQIAPLVARLHGGDGALATGRPHPPHNRLEADAMLIHRPDVDARGGMRRLNLR